MGINGLDLRWRLERTFEIELTEDEFFLLHTTPGTIQRLVWQRLQGIHPEITWDAVRLDWEILGWIRKYSTCHRSMFNLWNRVFTQESLEAMVTEMSDRLGIPIEFLQTHVAEAAESQACSPWALAEVLTNSILLQYAADLLPIRGRTPAKIPDDADKWTEDAVWQSIRQTIAECLSVDLCEVTTDVRMIQDLGME